MASTRGSASSASYEPWAVGIPWRSAATRALARLRDATASTSARGHASMAGMTRPVAMRAAPRIPQRTLAAASGVPPAAATVGAGTSDHGPVGDHPRLHHAHDPLADDIAVAVLFLHAGLVHDLHPAPDA